MPIIDVAPALQEEILKGLKQELANSKPFQHLCNELASGRANYATAHEVSQVVGENTTRVLQRVLRPEVLPDRRLYYNIAERTIKPAMETASNVVANYTEAMQTNLNRQAGINVKTVKPRQNTSTIDNLCGMASDYEDFADGAWILDAPTQNIIENTVDRFVRANAAFAEAAGLDPVVVRTAEADCCEWCANLEGTYPYAEVKAKGSDVYRRHNRCHCTTEYYPGAGNKAQNVWNHAEWREI